MSTLLVTVTAMIGPMALVVALWISVGWKYLASQVLQQGLAVGRHPLNRAATLAVLLVVFALLGPLMSLGDALTRRRRVR